MYILERISYLRHTRSLNMSGTSTVEILHRQRSVLQENGGLALTQATRSSVVSEVLSFHAKN